jgi:hypothetical protein
MLSPLMAAIAEIASIQLSLSADDRDDRPKTKSMGERMFSVSLAAGAVAAFDRIFNDCFESHRSG